MMNHTDRAAKAAPKSGHVRCNSPCLLWAKSGHCGASGSTPMIAVAVIYLSIWLYAGCVLLKVCPTAQALG
jgi:hypothetical protein